MKILKNIGLMLLLPILLIAAFALNNTFNDDKIETMVVKNINLEKEVDNLIVYESEMGGYLDEQQASTSLYNIKGSGAALSFLNVDETLVVAFNGDEDFAEDLRAFPGGECIYLFSTSEILHIELSSLDYLVVASFGSGINFIEDLDDINGDPIEDLTKVLPEKCWSTMPDKNCSSREMSNFIANDLFVYEIIVDDLSYISIYDDPNDVHNVDYLTNLKIYYK